VPKPEELKFVRMFDFRCIPRGLFEQTKELEDDEIDRIYTFGSTFVASPLTLLYVLIDSTNIIKGVLWAEINLINAVIFIRFFSVYKEYQSSKGELLNKAKDFLFGLKMGSGLKKEIHFLTTRPQAYKKIGARRSKNVRMEIDNVQIPKDKRPDDKDS